MVTAAPVGVLALQGSFPLHRRAIERCGRSVRDVRRPEDLSGLAALVLPGGESTTMANLAERYGTLDAMRDAGRSGLPMLGTCAGAILLGDGEESPPRLGLAPVEALRNAYGRQVHSFHADVELAPLAGRFHAVFIRAPKLRPRAGATAAEVEILGRFDEEPILLRSGPFVLSTFHPELTDDLRLHRWFLEKVAR